MRYHCQSCPFETDSEFECWKHNRDSQHEDFLDTAAQLEEGATGEIYRPADDPDVLTYA